MSCRDVGLDPGDVIDAMEAVGLAYPYNPSQTLIWHRPECGLLTNGENLSVIVHGYRPGSNGSRIQEIRLGFIDAKTRRLVVSTAGRFTPVRFAPWATPPGFDGEPPFFAEAKAEGWL